MLLACGARYSERFSVDMNQGVDHDLVSVV